MAASLIEQFTVKGDTIFDPFAGAGTVALEGWIADRNVIANDLSPYAMLITKAKLHPYSKLESALEDIIACTKIVEKEIEKADLRTVPPWVREFFHKETLREIISWISVLKNKNKDFLLACLLGILHHQRPGFLSFPSSHTVPYLRLKKFPKTQFPQLYNYRSLPERLEAKVRRAFKRAPTLNTKRQRTVTSLNSGKLTVSPAVDAIITSPPYMRQLHYGRDNRLRLWFLGMSQWKDLDQTISPSEVDFFRLMRDCFNVWKLSLKKGGVCVLILGDAMSKSLKKNLPEVVANIAINEVGGYSLLDLHRDTIPNIRRVRRNCRGSLSETIVVLVKT
jgi:DNA modification methylase